MIGGIPCDVFMSFVLSNGAKVSRKLDHEICVGLKTLKRKASDFKRVRLEQYNPWKCQASLC